MDPDSTLDYVTPIPRKSRASGILWTTATLLVFALAGYSILSPLGLNAPERVNRRNCAANLRAIGCVIQLYENQYHRYPATFGDLVSMASPVVMLCPSSTDVMATGTPQQLAKSVSTPGPNCSYVYLGANMGPTWPSNSIVAYEKLTNHAHGGMNVLYNDGQVAWLSAKQSQHLMSELQAGHNPPRPPK